MKINVTRPDSDKCLDDRGIIASQMRGDMDSMEKENYWQVSFQVRLDHQEEVNWGSSSEAWAETIRDPAPNL